jgi:hypothetical protein
MRTSRSTLTSLIGALLVSCGFSVSSALAGYTVTLMQQGPNVVATGSGAIDLTGLFPISSIQMQQAGMNPSGGSILTGPAAPTFVLEYAFISGPSNFGTGLLTAADSGSGDGVGILLGEALFVPAGYVSNQPLSDTSTYNNQTFSNLGVTPGIYEWAWGKGENQNFTINAVPEPRASLVFGAGLLVLLGVKLRRFLFGHRAA